ncbi:iron chelate uptake ABC transporter family permease subunit [Sinorhizobium sp. BG8]|uniref:FecCD family ABC transporter permease n=1 Tax=Sinorhizobium sp. BG8 TaxID=2613773 RepID=UPI00193CA572|nr:iron chelate uptake ABC transporter family permease subunit [Sinorhizobium sp. BG8]QRM56129.1 iron chelate uptake ABC transporter family permease subunit [Sinorhizobium sp. BG8]
MTGLEQSAGASLQGSPGGACGRKTFVLRLPVADISARIDIRSFLAGAFLLVLIAAVGAVALASGSLSIPVDDVFGALLGGSDERIRMVVVEWRLPRVLLSILLGMALGTSGAIFQSLTGNPLGSPDIIGFSAGSHTGALVVMLLFAGGYYETAAGAIAGGIVAAIAVYLLAWRGGIHGFRLIVTGIGVSAMLGAANLWMIRQADLQIALGAAFWAAGSLNGLGLDQLRPVAATLLILLPVTIPLGRKMRQLELGDALARASGVDADRTRIALMFVGVALTATATAAAGPIAFIALAAPQIARRLTGAAGVTLLSSALTGALLLAAADWAALHAFGVQLPVGIMTVSIGGIYFLWLLLREVRT